MTLAPHPQRLLVLGGTGFVGRALCARLVQRNGGGGGPIVVPTRRLPHAGPIRHLPTVEPVRADVHDPATLGRLLRGTDAVINLVAILHGSGRDFERVHVELPRKLAAACRAAGVRRVLHVSALGAGPGAPSLYLRSKTAGEEVLRSADQYTLPLALRSLQAPVNTEWGALMAGSAIAAIPLLILYVVFSRQLIAGLTAGAVK